jgi:hypothetical protein
MNRERQPHPLIVLGLNVWMGTAAGADELVKIPTDACVHPGPRRPPFIYRRCTCRRPGMPSAELHASWVAKDFTWNVFHSERFLAMKFATRFFNVTSKDLTVW